MDKTFLIIGSALSALAVMIGAFGAHALSPLLQANGRQGTFDTAVQYQIFHAIGILFVGILISQKSTHQLLPLSGWLFIIGIILFSGSLYVLALTNYTKLGMITPLGGLSFIAGWLTLIYYLIRIY